MMMNIAWARVTQVSNLPFLKGKRFIDAEVASQKLLQTNAI